VKNNDDMKRMIASAMLEKIESMPKVAGATAPIFGIDRTGKPQFLGSAVLLKIHNWHFALTAAHVLDNRSHTDLYIGSGDKVVLLRGSSYGSTVPPDNGNRKQDRIDIGMVRLSEATVQEMQEDDFLAIDDTCNLDTATTTGHYVLAGYPCSKHKRSIQGGEAKAITYSFVVDPAPLSDYQDTGLNPSINLLLRFDKQKLWRPSGPVVGPNMLGISGGGIWFVDNVYTTSPLNPLLVAIFIEWWEKTREKKPPKRLLATKLHVALSAIWSRFTELRPYLPTPVNAQQSNSLEN
jgi:hypothetical protein